MKRNKIFIIILLVILFVTLIFFWRFFQAEKMFDINVQFSEKITAFLIQYKSLAVFLGAFLFSEAAILPAFFLSGQGLLDPLQVAISALLGVSLANTMWFVLNDRLIFFGRKIFFSILNKISLMLDKLTPNKPFYALLFAHFLGIPAYFSCLYVRNKNIKLKKFLIFDIGGIIIWLSVLFPIGWFSGVGIYNLMPAYRNFGSITVSLLAFYVIYALAKAWIKRKIMEKVPSGQKI